VGSRPDRPAATIRRAGVGLAPPPTGTARTLSVSVLNCSVRPTGTSRRASRSPALAFGSHCSVFKERHGTHPRGVGAGSRGRPCRPGITHVRGPAPGCQSAPPTATSGTAVHRTLRLLTTLERTWAVAQLGGSTAGATSSVPARTPPTPRAGSCRRRHPGSGVPRPPHAGARDAP